MIHHHRVLCRRVTNPRHHFGLNVSPGATPWRLQTEEIALWKCEECEADERTRAAELGEAGGHVGTNMHLSRTQRPIGVLNFGGMGDEI